MGKFTRVKRKTAPDGPGPGRPRRAPQPAVARRLTHDQLATLLWHTDYRELFELEAQQEPEVVQMLQDAVAGQAGAV